MLVTFSIDMGIFITTGSILGPMYAPYGYEGSKISIFGAVAILSGVFGCLVTGVVLDRTKRFKRTLFIICVGSLIGYSWQCYAVPSGNWIVVILTNALLGFITVPIIPAGFSFSVELTHPAPPPLVNGLMMMFANTFGLIMSFVCVILCGINPLYALALLAICSIIPVICSLLITETLKRSRPS